MPDRDTAAGAESGRTPPLVGYLLLVPQGTDPRELLAGSTAHAEIRPVRPESTASSASGPPAPQAAEAWEPAPPYDAVRVDHERHIAEAGGRRLDLTYLEYALLAHFVAHPHRVHSRSRLVRSLWGYDHVGDGRTVDVHVARLRRKLGPVHRHRIVTVRRVGYKYVPDAGS